MLTSTKDTRVVQPQAAKDISVVQVKVTKDTSLKAKFNVITLTLAIIGLTSVVDVAAEAKPAAPAAGGAVTTTAAGSTLEARAERLSEVCLRIMDKVVKELKYPDIPNTGWGRRSHDCLQTLMGLVLYTWRINLSRMVPPGQWGTWLGEKAQVDEISRLNEEVKQKIRRIDEFNNQTPTDQDEISKEIQLQIQRNLIWRYWLSQKRTIKSMQDFTVPTLTKDTSGKERTYTPKKMNEIIMAFWALVTKEGREELERKSGTDVTAITVRDVIVDALCQFACAQALDDDTGAPTIGTVDTPTIGTVYNRLKKSKLVDIKSPHPMLNPKDVNNTDKNKRENGQLYNELKDVNKLSVSDDLRLEETELFQGIFKKVDALYEDSKKQGGKDIQEIQNTLPPGQDLRGAVEAKLADLEKQLKTALEAEGPVETEPNEGDTTSPPAPPVQTAAPPAKSPADAKQSAPAPTPPAANNVQPAPPIPPADAKPATSAQTAAAKSPADAKQSAPAQTAAATPPADAKQSTPAAKSTAANTVQQSASGVTPALATAAATTTTPATGDKVTTPADSVTKSTAPAPTPPAANNVQPAPPIPPAAITTAQQSTSAAKSPAKSTAPAAPAKANTAPPAISPADVKQSAPAQTAAATTPPADAKLATPILRKSASLPAENTVQQPSILRKSASLPADGSKSNSSVLGRATSALRTYTQRDLQEMARQRDALVSGLPSIKIPSFRRSKTI
jgi:hypothetical protein